MGEEAEGVETRASAPARPPRWVFVRRRRDLVALGLAALVLAGSWLLAERGVTEAERSVFRALNRMSRDVAIPIVGIMQLGSLASVAVASLVAVVVRRWWEAFTLGSAGLLAWSAARAVKVIVERGRPLDVFPEADVLVEGPIAHGLGFPSGHAGVSTALVLAVVPYLAWRYRAALLALPLIVGFARVYVGAHLPLDVIGGLAVGVAAASGFFLLFGRPIGWELDREPPTPPEVEPPPEPPR